MDTPYRSSDRRTLHNPDKPSEDHRIEWLSEARQAYQSELPPFVERNQGSNRAGNRKNVRLRPTEGQEQRLPVEAEIMCWSWSNSWTFYTIDLGGRRLIIKGDTTDHRYCSYRSWEGPNGGFSFHPVAFGPSQVQYEYTSQPDWRPSFSPINHPRPSSARPMNPNPEYPAQQPNAQGKQPYSRTGSIAQPASPSTEASPKPRQAKDGDIQITTTPVHHSSQQRAQAKGGREPSRGLIQSLLSPKSRETSVNHPCDSDQAVPSRRPSNGSSKVEEDNGHFSKLKEDSATESRIAHPTSAEPANERSTSRNPRGASEEVPIPHKPQPQDHNPAEPSHLAKSTKRKRQTSTSNPVDPTSPHLSTATRSQSTRSSPQPTLSATSQNQSGLSTPLTTSLTSHSSTQPPPPHSSSTTSASALLPPYKQSHTTLFIAIPLSTDTVPLKLRSCMSLSSFFSSVLSVSANDTDVVSGIRATFDWKAPADVDRCILLKRDLEDTWEVFLEIVEGAPCWRGEGGGRCGVGVEVVLV